jgi:acyl-coenzyme A thioesterase PaaI-like protein
MTMSSAAAFQDQMVHNHCFGCGPNNPHGLHLKSFWSGDNEAICHFTPQPYHCAGSKQFVYGGIVASIMDCHTICTAIANAYRQAGRAIGSEPSVMFATGRLEVNYKKPVPVGATLLVKALILETGARKTILRAEVWVGNELYADAHVIAVNVGDTWRQ